jgi:hypothetical protein
MRPKIKDDAQRVSLTLSAPKREILMAMAIARGVSRTQIVEDLLNEYACLNSTIQREGKAVPQTKFGGNVSNIHNPSGGGCGIPIQNLGTSKEKRRAK